MSCGSPGDSIVVQPAMFLACGESVFPLILKPDHLIFFQCWTYQLENSEAKMFGVALTQESIAPVARFGIATPSAKQVFCTVRRTNVAFAIRSVRDVVNAAPLRKLDLPDSGYDLELLPTQ